MNRRSFLSGIIAAPVVITTPELLMPIKARTEQICTLSWYEKRGDSGIWTRQSKCLIENAAGQLIGWPEEIPNTQREFFQLETGNFENQI